MKTVLIAIVLLAAIIGFGYAMFSNRVAQAPGEEVIASFKNCVAAGNPVM